MKTAPTIIMPEGSKTTSALANYATFSAPTITSASDLQEASDERRAIKALLKEADAERKRYTVPLDAVRAEVQSFFRPFIEAGQRAVDLLDSSILSFQQELDRKTREEEERLRIQAEREVEELKAQAEREATAAVLRGDTTSAEAILASTANLVAAEVEILPLKARTAGLTMRDVWKFEVIDFAALPDDFKMADEKAIRGFVTARKEKAVIPGVRVFVEKVVAGTK